MTLRCIIVDDELPALDELSHLLTEIEGVEVLACVDNGQKALTEIKELKPDVVFLDIKMPGLNGFAVAKEILTFKHSPLIVFATAYDEYAIDAFDVKAIDYILKPFSKKRLGKTVQRLREVGAKALNPSDLRDIIDKLKGNLSTREFIRVSVLDNGKIRLLSPKRYFFAALTKADPGSMSRTNPFPARQPLMSWRNI